MIKKIKSLFWKIYSFNNKEYKENYYGSFTTWRLFLVNIFKPGRLINRIRYGQFFLTNKKKIKTFNQIIDSNKNLISEEKKNKLNSGFNDLLKYGGCVIENYFDSEEIDKLKSEYLETIDTLKKDCKENKNIHLNDIMPLSNSLLNVWLDEGLMTILKGYLGKKIYARNYPCMMYSKVSKEFSSKNSANGSGVRWANDWHVDHSVLFNVHVILNDIEEESSRMQILKESDKFLHYGSNFSDELVSKTNFKKIDCIGKRGTVYLHSGNVVHRFKPEANTDRLITHFEFSPGSNILMHTKGIAKSLKNDFDIDSLEKKKMDIIYPIFPRNLFKGYDIKENHYQPTRYRGI